MNPAHARQGVGRLILALCEEVARMSGFRRVKLMATMAGEPLNRAYGYSVIERAARLAPDGVAVPGAVMDKDLG